MSINQVGFFYKEDVFQATYPKHMQKSLLRKIINVAYDIISKIIFPIYICRYIHFKIHTLLGYYFFVPSQFYSKKRKIINWFSSTKKEVSQKKYIKEGRSRLKELFDAKSVNIKTADGARLNGVFIPGKDIYGNRLAQDAPLIIHFLGQTGRYEDLGHCPEALSNIKGYNVLVFNDRGVLKSSSIATREGLFLDAEAILQFAKKRLNVEKHKIILHGHSFGAVKATYLAGKHSDLKVLNDRSFSTTENAVYYMGKELFHQVFSYFIIMPFVLIDKFASQRLANKVKEFVKKHDIYLDEKLLRPYVLAKIIRAVACVFAYFSAKFSVFFGWGIYLNKYWKKIKAKKLILFLENDNVIPFEASFFKSVKKTEEEFVMIREQNMIHWSALSQDILNIVLKTLHF